MSEKCDCDDCTAADFEYTYTYGDLEPQERGNLHALEDASRILRNAITTLLAFGDIRAGEAGALNAAADVAGNISARRAQTLLSALRTRTKGEPNV